MNPLALIFGACLKVKETLKDSSNGTLPYGLLKTGMPDIQIGKTDFEFIDRIILVHGQMDMPFERMLCIGWKLARFLQNRATSIIKTTTDRMTNLKTLN
jgi:hypothetical protein